MSVEKITEQSKLEALLPQPEPLGGWSGPNEDAIADALLKLKCSDECYEMVNVCGIPDECPESEVAVDLMLVAAMNAGAALALGATESGVKRSDPPSE